VLVSERTGYPEDMLGIDLDLEADLGVDSIKRVEILSALQNESSFGTLTLEGEIENLSKLKTLNTIAQWITERAGSAPKIEEKTVVNRLQVQEPPASKELPVSRMRIEVVEAPPAAESAAGPISGLVLITDDGAIAELLAEELDGMGVPSH